MKICILATTFPRFKGDIIPQFTHGLARALVETGAAVTVIAPHDRDTIGHEFIDGVEIRRIRYWWPKSLQGLCYGAGIPSNIRRQKWVALQFPALEAAFLAAALRYGADADIYNAHWSFAALPTVFASKIARKPLVTHAYSAEYIPRSLRPLNRFIVRHSASVISISRYAHDMVEQTASPRYHEIIGYGVNQEKIAPPDFDAAAFRERMGIAPGEFLVFAVGRLVERKGYHVLIDAVAELVSQGMRVRLLVGGVGPLHDTLSAQIQSAGITQQAQMLGFVPDEELNRYIKAADVLVMPSVLDKTGDTEGLGIPLLEGMANGTPVIGSDTGGIVDIVTHEKTGLLVPPADPHALAAAIKRLQGDAELRQLFAETGYQLVNSTFSWKNIAARTLALFETALAQQRT
jgi:glycosyltransferase involved in cell wall biosynthesis